MKTWSPYTEVGYVLHNGQLSCVECVDFDRCPYPPPPVRLDSSPHAFEECDSCGVVLNHRFKSPEGAA